MSLITTARQTVATSVHNLLRGAPSTAERRLAFKQEFGFFPVGSEVTETERTVFAREAVRPILEQRARAIDQPPATAASRDANLTSFTRAYLLARGLNLAERGRSYRDYLVPPDRSAQDSIAPYDEPASGSTGHDAGKT